MVGHRFYDGDGGFASHVSVNTPANVVLHPITGDLFIADTLNHIIRRIDRVTGVITTVAGTVRAQGYAGDGELATRSMLSSPTSVAFSLDGQSMYIADSENNRVRMVKDGIITTVAGNENEGYDRDGVLATNTSLKTPLDVTIVPTTGELLIADSYNHRIRKVDQNGIISTIAGTGDEESNLGDNGPATNASLKSPVGIVVNSIGETFVADSGNFRVRKISTAGVITTIAGTGVMGYTGDNGPAINAKIGITGGLALNSIGDLLMADKSNSCIRSVVKGTQIVTTVAGVCRSGGYMGDNVSATTTRLNGPTGVSVNGDGEIIIADSVNHRIRKVSIDGIINTIGGNGVAGFSGESGIAIDAKLDSPTSVAITYNGEVIISDAFNRKIRKVDKNGIITAIAGSGVWGFGGMVEVHLMHY